MHAFLDAAFTLPTAFFSVLLLLAGAYWLMVIVGGLGLELLDRLGEMFDGLGGMDGAIEGTVEGVLNGVAEGALDGLDMETHGRQGGQGGAMRRMLGIGQIPCTIPLTLLASFGWLVSYLGMRHLPVLLPVLGGGLLLAIVVGLGASGIAFLATAAAVRPLARLLAIGPATGRAELVGRLCTLRTQRVDVAFGQAEARLDGGSFLIQVRCLDRNSLKRGSQALIYDYDPDKEVFLVSALNEEMLTPGDNPRASE